MRSFSPGYYRNLTAMLNFLRIRYHIERLLFVFSLDVGDSRAPPSPYYTHASNLHRIIPPIPTGVNPFRHAVQVILLAACYLWLSACCFLIAPSDDETLGTYLGRIWIPRWFTSQYLLPLISSVATCSHEALLQFPARDFVTYRRKLFGTDHYTVENGIWDVERKLRNGLDVRLGAEVEKAEPVHAGLRLQWLISGDGVTHKHTCVFDHVVLAVPPNIIARIFSPLCGVMSRIPTADVQTFVLQPKTGPSRLSVVDADRKTQRLLNNRHNAQVVTLRSRSAPTQWTAAYQKLHSGACVATNADEAFDKGSVLVEARFTRVLRTVESRKLTSQMFSEEDQACDIPKTRWRNGDGGVWVAGAWCWDGMVLLEGCVVSAMRIAKALDVEVPWATT